MSNPIFSRMIRAVVASFLICAAPVSAQVLNPSLGEDSSASNESDPVTTDLPLNPGFSQRTEVYENWSLQCQESNGEGRCFVETVIRQNKPTVRDVLALRFIQRQDDIEFIVVTPNRVKLDRGVTFSAGDDDINAPYKICSPSSCSATVSVPKDLPEKISSESEVFVSFYLFAAKSEGGEREIKIPIKTNGFSVAFENLTSFETNE